MTERSFPLERLTSLKVGGPAEYLARPRTERELGRILTEAAAADRPVRAIGGGKNLLVDDAGVRGTVVALGGLRGIRREGVVLVAGAGVTTIGFVGRCVREGLAGAECLVGVPGTMGGAARMNAGGIGGAIGDRIAWVRGLTASGTPFRWNREMCGFRYRGSRLGGSFVTEVALELIPDETGLRDRIRENYTTKRKSQPLNAATAGCVFKNPADSGGMSAGMLLDRAGAKELRCGGAAVSRRHANFIVNRGGARFSEVAELLRACHRLVTDRFGVDLELELEVWREEETGTVLVA